MTGAERADRRCPLPQPPSRPPHLRPRPRYGRRLSLRPGHRRRRLEDAPPPSRPATTTSKEGQLESDLAMPPVHPGEILLTEFLEPLELSQYQLARSISVSARRINEIVHGDRRISADTALRLAGFFGTSERFWMNLQSRYDLEIEKDRLGPTLDGIRPLTAASLRTIPSGTPPRDATASHAGTRRRPARVPSLRADRLRLTSRVTRVVDRRRSWPARSGPARSGCPVAPDRW
jgi:addiction module HigA family antidote